MDRRNFLKNTIIGAGILATGPLSLQTVRAQSPGKAAVLKLCSQEGRVPGATLKEKVEKLQRWGAVGIEFGGNPADRIAEIKQTLKGTGIKVSALCWGAHKGDLVSLDMEKRKKGIEDIKSALVTAGELESTGVIFVPCFNKESTLSPEELGKILADILPEIGDYAKKCNTRVLLEPLNNRETFYIKRLEQAVEICNKLNNEGICMMGDFYHMSKEETDQAQAFVTAGKWLHHVHLATGKSRILPAQEPHSYVEGFRGLKKIGYQDYCSLECGIRKGSNPNEDIPKAFKFLRQQWDEATI